jgi:hypothetical protein
LKEILSLVTPAKEQEYLTRIHTQDVAINQLKKQNELLQQQVNSLTEILIQMSEYGGLREPVASE